MDKAAMPCVVGEGVEFGRCLDGSEAIEGVIGIAGVIVSGRCAVGIVDEDVEDLVEVVMGVGGVVLGETVVMGVVGVGTEGFFG